MNTIMNTIYNLTWLSLVAYLLIRFLVNRYSLYQFIMKDETTIFSFSDGHIFIRKIRFTDFFFKMFGLSVVGTVIFAIFGMPLTGHFIFSIVVNSLVLSLVASVSMNSRILDESEYIQTQTGLFVKYY